MGRRGRKPVILPDKRIVLADPLEIRRLLDFYKVPQESLEKSYKEEVKTLSRRQKRKVRDKAIAAPDVIAELEEWEDIQFVLKEAEKLLQ